MKAKLDGIILSASWYWVGDLFVTILWLVEVFCVIMDNRFFFTRNWAVKHDYLTNEAGVMCTDYKNHQLTTLELTVGWFLGLKVK